ncbi:MAG: hypothetical protein JNL82_03745 [Myxococcales bacterium]|nr:hypothetical protein [Myxococcales bacterium]
MLRALRTLAVSSVLLSMNTGCLNGADRATRTIVPSALDSSVGFLESSDNQARIRRIMESPEIQKALGEMVDGLVGGAIDSGTDEQRMARVRDVSTKFIAATSKALSDSLENELGPAAAHSAERLVASTLHAALSPQTRKGAAQMVDAVTRAAVAGFSESAGEGLRDDLGPAIAKVLQVDLGPALERVVADNLVPAMDEALCEIMPQVNDATRDLTRHALLGVGDALDDEEFQDSVGRFADAVLLRADSALNRGIGLAAIIAIVLGLLVIVLGLIVTRVYLARRRVEKERAHSERMLLLVVQAMQSAQDKPDVEALLRDIHERETDLGDEGFLDELTRRVRGARRAA